MIEKRKAPITKHHKRFSLAILFFRLKFSRNLRLKSAVKAGFIGGPYTISLK